MVTDRAPPRYRSYLLRFWQERRAAGDEQPVWRFSLDDPITRVRHGYASLAHLVAAVCLEMGETRDTFVNGQENTMHQHNYAVDEAAILATIHQIESGWNAGDGDAFAAPFAPDADYVVVDGRYLHGDQAIAAGHKHIFATIYRGSRNRATVRGVRWLREDVALAHVEWHLQYQQGDTLREARAINTLVLTKDDGIWRINAFHNTPLTWEFGVGNRESGVGEPSTHTTRIHE